MKRVLKLMLLMLVCLTQMGCFNTLAQLVALPFQVAGKALDVVSKVPIPPGIF